MLFPDPARRTRTVPLSSAVYPPAGSYVSASGRGFPHLSQWVYVLVFMSHGGLLTSVHLSGMMNGFTQVMPPAGAACAVAVAWMSILVTPNSRPSSVGTASCRPTVRNTSTFTSFACPKLSSGNVTSDGSADTALPITLSCCAVLRALCTAGPVPLRSAQLSQTTARAPDSA